jgi:hypothetical protein
VYGDVVPQLRIYLQNRADIGIWFERVHVREVGRKRNRVIANIRPDIKAHAARFQLGKDKPFQCGQVFVLEPSINVQLGRDVIESEPDQSGPSLHQVTTVLP